MDFNHPNILKWKYFVAKNKPWEDDFVLVISGKSGGYLFRSNGIRYEKEINSCYILSYCTKWNKLVSFEDGIKLLTKKGLTNFCKFLKIPLTPVKKISEFTEKDVLSLYCLLNQKKAFCADSALDLSKYEELSELIDALAEENKIKESKCSPNHYFLVGNTLTEIGK